jgi:sulfide:quinone oxidoreductase
MSAAGPAASMRSMTTTPDQQARVLIAGAGIAGIEAALALRAFAGSAVHVRLIDPARRFRVPATATGRAFGAGTGTDHPLADVAARAGATLTQGRLAAVDPGRHMAMLAGGQLLTYDALIVAVGARAEPSVRGALNFAGHADVESVRGMVGEITQAGSRGAETHLAVVVPGGCAWPLAAYELALMAREHLTASEGGDAVEIAVVTAEDTPLAIFGPEASAAVARKLDRAGIAIHAGAVVRGWRWGQLELLAGGTLRADRVIALPVQRGPALEGLPTDAHGFLRTVGDGSVPGAPDVWAVGDGSSFPVKQGGIACQQADSVAAAIARRLGIEVDEVPFMPTLRAWVWDGRGGKFLRADLPGGRTESTGVAGDTPLWWPVAKVAGRFLAPFLQAWPADLPLTDLPSPAVLSR